MFLFHFIYFGSVLYCWKVHRWPTMRRELGGVEVCWTFFFCVFVCVCVFEIGLEWDISAVSFIFLRRKQSNYADVNLNTLHFGHGWWWHERSWILPDVCGFWFGCWLAFAIRFLMLLGSHFPLEKLSHFFFLCLLARPKASKQLGLTGGRKNRGQIVHKKSRFFDGCYDCPSQWKSNH